MTFEQLQLELFKSIKNKDRRKENILKEIVATARNMAIEKKQKDDITEEIINAAILKSKKVCQEQIDTCPAERANILAEYKANLECINLYAPQMMSEDEVWKEVYAILARTDIQGFGKGAVMKVVMPKLKGKADGKIINKVVTEICQKSGEC